MGKCFIIYFNSCLMHHMYVVCSSDQVDEEQTWSTLFAPPPVSSVITANIMHADDLRSLVTGYVHALPQALRQFISVDPFSDDVDPPSAAVRMDSKLER
ncbi:hypothetical protein EON65_06345 [archaeon]|nr:MAG: hypothetical protein EON65_06345 [archaeon]